MRVSSLLILAAVLNATLFAQKLENPEARNKRAVSVASTRPTNSVQKHRARSDGTSVPKSGSSSAKELAKIERSSIQQMKTTHKETASSKLGSQTVPQTQPQTKSKPMKFSYHPPQPAVKTSIKNPTPPPVRPQQGMH